MLDIEDSNLPDDLQGHTKRFSNPGKMAIVIGDDE